MLLFFGVSKSIIIFALVINSREESARLKFGFLRARAHEEENLSKYSIICQRFIFVHFFTYENAA